MSADINSNLSNKKKQHSTKDQCAEVSWCFYFEQANVIDGRVVEGTRSAWRSRDPNIHQGTNRDTLAHTRRWIGSTRKFTDIELVDMKNCACQTTERQLTESHRDCDGVRARTTGHPPKNPVDPETAFQRLQNPITNLTELE